MAKKRVTQKPPPKSDHATPAHPSGDVSWDDLMELVRQGYLTLAGTGTEGDSLMDAVFVPVPEELRVPTSVDPETRLAEDRLLIEQRTLPERLHKELRNDAAALWEYFKRTKLKPTIEAVTGKPFAEVWETISQHNPYDLGSEFASEMMFAGFDAALERYARELQHVPELAEWRRKRKQGGDKGRKGSTSRKVDLAQRIRDKWAAMEAAGENPTNASVAAAIKKECGRGSIRTVQRAFSLPVEKTTPAKRTKR